jgi:hypothetical protein
MQLYVIKFCQWLATGQWFSPGTPDSSIDKTDHHNNSWNIVEIVVKHHKRNPKGWMSTTSLTLKIKTMLNIHPGVF